MKKLVIILGGIVVLAQLASPVAADKIYLQTGEVLDGKVVEQDSAAVTIMVGQVPMKYYHAQIERLEMDDPAVALTLPEGLKLEDLPLISEKKVRLILKFMEVNGLRKNVEDRVAEAIKNAPAGREDEFKFVFRVGELFKVLIPIYDTHYTEQDLRELINFFESPVGKKTIEVTPAITQEVVEKMMGYFTNLTKMPEI